MFRTIVNTVRQLGVHNIGFYEKKKKMEIDHISRFQEICHNSKSILLQKEKSDILLKKLYAKSVKRLSDLPATNGDRLVVNLSKKENGSLLFFFGGEGGNETYPVVTLFSQMCNMIHESGLQS